MNTVDDRTPVWKASHEMTDPRNQLPTEAERQEYSARRMSNKEFDERLDALERNSKRIKRELKSLDRALRWESFKIRAAKVWTNTPTIIKLGILASVVQSLVWIIFTAFVVQVTP